MAEVQELCYVKARQVVEREFILKIDPAEIAVLACAQLFQIAAGIAKPLWAWRLWPACTPLMRRIFSGGFQGS